MDTPYATIHVHSVASTQDEAQRAYRGTPLLVTADHQTAGRGRSGRTWLAAPRAVFASLAFDAGWPAGASPRLSLLAGLAARDALEAEVWLKWPNDLVAAGGAKVGGLLAQSESGAPLVVLGLGVNLWWPDPPDGAGALCAADPGPGYAAQVAAAWAAGVLARTRRGPADWGRDEYRAACATLATELTWEGGGPGRAVDVDADGALLVATADGTVRLTAGEVRQVRPATLRRRSSPSMRSNPTMEVRP